MWRYMRVDDCGRVRRRALKKVAPSAYLLKKKHFVSYCLDNENIGDRDTNKLRPKVMASKKADFLYFPCLGGSRVVTCFWLVVACDMVRGLYD